MKKNRGIQLSIPEPCTQSWDGMTPMGGGRHCIECRKVVVDFTVMTDRELIQYFQKGGAGCGRFHASQLDRVIVPPYVVKQPMWAKLAFGLTALLGLAKTSDARTRNTEMIALQSAATDDKLRNLSATSYKGINGWVKDSNNAPLPFVSVSVEDQNGCVIQSTTTDSNGYYTFRLSNHIADSFVTVCFHTGGQVQRYSGIQIITDLTVRVDYFLPKNYVDAPVCRPMYTAYTGVFVTRPTSQRSAQTLFFEQGATSGTPINITLPSFKFVGRFAKRVHHWLRPKKSA